MSRSHYVLTYDSDMDSSRRKVRSAIRAFGGWKQYSVFECLLSPTNLAELIDRLERIIRECDGTTRVRIYRISQDEDDLITLPPSEDTSSSSGNVI